MRARTRRRSSGSARRRDADVRIDRLALDDQARPRFRLVTPAGSAKVALQLSGAHQALERRRGGRGRACRGHGARRDRRRARRGRPTAQRAPDAGDGARRRPARRRRRLQRQSRVGAGRARRLGRAGSGSATGRAGRCSARCASSAPTRPTLHGRSVAQAAELGIDHLVVVGDRPRTPSRPAPRSVDGLARHRRRRALMSTSRPRWSRPPCRAEDVVLVKASNALGLWRVAEALLAPDRRRRAGRGHA